MSLYLSLKGFPISSTGLIPVWQPVGYMMKMDTDPEGVACRTNA